MGLQVLFLTLVVVFLLSGVHFSSAAEDEFTQLPSKGSKGSAVLPRNLEIQFCSS